MRLIDADQMAFDESEAYMAAQAQISDDALWRTNAVVHIKIQQLISDTPTVDAVPVVRCRDCAFCYTTGYSSGHRCGLYIDFHPIGAADFCSYGERKEVGNENHA